jgi:hypothetical protein
LSASARIFTFAEGMFSRLAHDLELSARATEVEGALDEAGTGKITASFRAGDVDLVGFVKNGVTDPNAPTASDRSDIRERMLGAIGAKPDSRIAARADVSADRVVVELEIPLGRARAEAPVKKIGDARVARLAFSMAALGMKPVKGPLNAFRLSDKIEIEVRLE